MHHQRLIQSIARRNNPSNQEGRESTFCLATITANLLLTSVTSLSLGLVSQADASTGVHDGRLLDDESIPFQTSNVTARVGQGNFVGLVGIQPNFALSALEDGGGEALLELKIDCKIKQKRQTQ